MRIVCVLSMLFCVVALAGCPVSNPDDITLGTADDGKQFAVPTGAKITVVIPGNATTGYQWQTLPEGIFPALALLDESYKAAGTAPGSSGEFTFVFRAMKAGAGHISLGLFPPGAAAGAAPEETWACDITATGNPITPVKVTMKDEDSFEMRALPLEGELRVTLSENPSTGYEWLINKDGSPVLALDEAQSGFTAGAGAAVGTAGTHTFVFDAVQAGVTSIKLELRRAGTTEPSDTFEASVFAG